LDLQLIQKKQEQGLIPKKAKL